MALRTDLLDPIEGSNPAGEDLTYEIALDELQEARRADLDVEQGDWERPVKRADHATAVKLAGDLLATRSKDLGVAAWLADSLLQHEGFGGFREGLDFVRELLDTFWDHVYPELEDDDSELRAGPLNWLGSKLDIQIKQQGLNQAGHSYLVYGQSRLIPTEEDAAGDDAAAARRKTAIEEGKTTSEEFQQSFSSTPKAWYKELVANIVGCVESVDALDAKCRERFGEYDAPSFVGLRRSLEEVRGTAQGFLDEKLKLDPDPIEATPVPVDDGFGGVSAAAGSATVAGGLSPEPTSEADATARIATAARYLRGLEQHNPGPYLMLRGLRWGELRAGGGDVDPKLLDAPPTATRKHLKGLLLDEQWQDLLEACEQVMASSHGRGWLDLQRYVLTALDHLGEEYAQIRSAVRSSLRSLLLDLPNLPELTLMDDTGTANVETRAWIRAEIIDDGELDAAIEETQDRAQSQQTSAMAGDARGVLQRALSSVRSGEPQKGVALLLKHAEQEKGERARFLSRSEAAAILVDHDMKRVALPMLQEMLAKIDAHTLEDWESGEVVARPLGLLYRCLADYDDGTRDSLYERICRLDPILGMGIQGTAETGSPAAADDSWEEEATSDWDEEQPAAEDDGSDW